MNRIYVVEDDKVIASQIKNHLESWGYVVKTAQDFKAVLEEFTDFQPHLVLMDISLPFFDGYYWCEELRKRTKVPIIFLSSVSDNMNIVMAMNMGADDFVPKPFDMSVLTAKIQAILRRAYSFRDEVNVMERSGVILDLGSTALTYEGSKIDLTKNEFRIIQALMENAGHVVSRDEIIRKLWEEEDFIDDNTLTVNMTRLRKKLEEKGLEGFIVTKKGVGYIIE